MIPIHRTQKAAISVIFSILLFNNRQLTNVVHITTPAFECILPDDIITCIAWISDMAVVVGCASGYIAAWELIDDGTPLVPYLYMPIHQTYITALTTCYPSFPHHIVTCSMDGYSRLTSLPSPEADTVPNNRSRIAPCAITYIDAIQAAVSIEEGTWVKFFPVRRFFSSTTVCKHNGIVRALAGSPLHTFTLSGGTEGEAAFSNPSRRVFHGKIKNYMQVWFQVEYSESTDTLRMTEGFKLEECEGKAKTDGNGKQLLTTVYPEQIGISAACWNTNLAFGGWAAAGLSCGLVRMEDVAIDNSG
jgi:transcription factor C subunit 6